MSHSEVLLQVPSDLAYELTEAQIGEPYIRRERTDANLIVQIAITATTAATTVITTKLTSDAVQRIAKAISSWRRRHEQEDAVTLVILIPDGPQSIEVELTSATSDDEIAQVIDRVRIAEDS